MGSQERKVAEEEEYCNRLTGALLPFANNKIEFHFVGSQLRREWPRKKASIPSNLTHAKYCGNRQKKPAQVG